MKVKVTIKATIKLDDKDVKLLKNATPAEAFATIAQAEDLEVKVEKSKGK